MSYHPPFTIPPLLIDLVSRISDELGRWAAGEVAMSPQLRREKRIRSIQASLAIENNSLSRDQVTAILEGKRVRGLPREIQALLDAVLASGKSDPVRRLLSVLDSSETVGVQELMRRMGLAHKTYFRRNYLKPALETGLLTMTQPDSPNSSTQRYRLTGKAPQI